MQDEAANSEPAAAYLQRRIRIDFELVFAVLAAANLGIADLLQDGPRSVADLADRAGAHPASLHRLLRALASCGMFREGPDGQFSLTTLAEPLRDDAPDSVRHQALWTGSQAYLRTWSGLVHSVRTGECAFEHVYGRPFFDFVKDDPELARIFNDVMTGSSGQDDGVAILESHDFGAYRQVVDVGGGHGALLGLILNRYPDVSGVLFDAPEVVASTDESFDRLVTKGRATKVAGDFFHGVPPGAGAYVLKFIVHDWDDEPALTILKNCREAMPEDGSVLLVEVIRPVTDTSPDASFLDLTMLLFLHGRERTEAEYAELLQRAGLTLVRTTPTVSAFSIMEAKRP